MDLRTPKQAPIDIWSFPHFMTGFVMGAYGLRADTTFAVSTAFELGENALAEVLPLREVIPGAGTESAVNAVVDVGLNMLGWAVARKIMGAGARRRNLGRRRRLR